MGDRGPPPKPAALRELEGDRSNRPKPGPEPKFDKAPERGAPPAHLPPIAAEEWRRLYEPLRLCGLLQLPDLTAFEAYCAAYARWREAEAELAKRDPSGASLMLLQTPGKPGKNGAPATGGSVMVNPWQWISKAAANDMRAWMREFGLTPAARTRMAMAYRPPAPEPEGEGDEPPQPAAPEGIEAGKFGGLIGKQRAH